jgi:dnd system-associated protein 4
MADRVRRPHQFEALLSDLARDKDKVFDTLAAALVFAACLGFKRGQRVTFEKSSEPINMTSFNGAFDQSVMNTIAIATVNDPFIMAKEREDEKIRIFEEYACGGLGILENVLGDGQFSRHEALLNLVLAEEKTGGIIDSITALAG